MGEVKHLILQVMKPTRLSPEFYTNLYKRICETDIDVDNEDTCTVYLDFEDVEGCYVFLKATFMVEVVDDSFDHAFGTEYCYHREVGELTDIEEVRLWDQDDNRADELFDYAAFWEQKRKALNVA